MTWLRNRAFTKCWWDNSFISSMLHLFWCQLIQLGTRMYDITWQSAFNLIQIAAVDSVQFGARRQCFWNQLRTIKHHQVVLSTSSPWRCNMHNFTTEYIVHTTHTHTQSHSNIAYSAIQSYTVASFHSYFSTILSLDDIHINTYIIA